MEAEESIYEGERLGEEQPENDISNFIAEPLTYGTYSYDDGTGTTGTANVGFYSDESGGDYISIICWRNDCEIAYFNGMLEADGESYYAYYEGADTSILVTFADGGLYVQIIDSDFADTYRMEGFYSLTAALNLNEVS